MKEVKRRTAVYLILAACFLALAVAVAPLCAQEKKADTDNMQILREKIQADKKLLVAANMDFTDAEAKAFWPVYQEYQSKLAKNNERIGKLIGEYVSNYKSMTNEMAQKLMKESQAIEKERLALKELYLPKFQKVLPAMKAVRYLQIENKIQAVVNYELADSIPLVQ